MPHPRPPPSTLSSLDTLTTTPPPTLSQTQSIARVLANTGKHIYRVESPDGRELLVELAKMYRSVVWVRRNRFVLVDTEGYEGKGGKVAGEIKVVVRGEKGWMGMGYWYVVSFSNGGGGGLMWGGGGIHRPKHFTIGYEGEDEMYEGQEESVVGKMPPGSDDDEEEEEGEVVGGSK